MAVAGCINAYDCSGCLIRTLECLQSSNIGVGVQYCAPNPLDDKRLDYIKYTDKCGCTCCLSAENEILIYATDGVIKNLTLTNDDVNEAIKIKWNDIFGSNRVKTVVRYKTGSYPTSITDGTLAVEETTKNQYSSTPFSLSGVLDEITYYITAFAVDSNNVVIGTQQTTITTDFGWHPSANTYAYYSFDDRGVNGYITDKSGNGRNATGGTQPSYVLVSGSKYAGDFYNPSSGTVPSGDMNGLSTTKFTEVVRAKPLDDGQQYITYILGNYQQAIIYGYNSKQIEFYSYQGSTTYRTTIKSGTSLNKWYCIGFTRNGTTIKTYLDGVYVGTIQVPAPTISLINVGGAGGSGRFHGLIGALILENNVEWSLSDFQGYYNKTKGKYGL